MDCAGDHSVDAATSGAAVLAVMLWWAGAQMMKEEMREGGKWFFEKNKRVMLKMHNEQGRCRCWRAPCP